MSDGLDWMDLSQTTTTPRAPLYRAVLITICCILGKILSIQNPVTQEVRSLKPPEVNQILREASQEEGSHNTISHLSIQNDDSV